MQKTYDQQLSEYYSIWREINALYDIWAKQHGISSNTLYVYYSLYEDNNCTQKEICTKWCLPKQTVNTILKDLEKKNYITLASQSNDRRNKTIKLTQTGKDHIFKIVKALKTKELTILRTMRHSEVESFIQSFKRFTELFKRGLEND